MSASIDNSHQTRFISQKEQNLIQSYVSSNQNTWMQELSGTKKTSIFIRKNESKLPFSIEYWKDNTTLVYKKIEVTRGQTKKILLAIDPSTNTCYARIKPTLRKHKRLLIEDAKTTDLFRGKPEIISNIYQSFYKSKSGKREKFHVIRELYSDTLSDVQKETLNTEAIEFIAIESITALAAIHCKGLIHNRMHSGNILVQKNGVKISKISICDLSPAKQSGVHKKSHWKLIRAQRTETVRLLELLKNLYISQGEQIPKTLYDLTPLSGKKPTSTEALSIMKLDYGN